MSVNTLTTSDLIKIDSLNTIIGLGSISSKNAPGTIAIGVDAGQAATGVMHGTFIGYQSGMHATGDYDTLVGYQTGQSLTTGDTNTLIGRYAGQDLTIENDNTFVGWGAGRHRTSVSSVCIGMEAGCTAGSSILVAIGYKAGYNVTSGQQNIFIGYQAGYGNTDMNFDKSIKIGHNESTIQQDTSSIYIGSRILPACVNGSTDIAIGYKIGSSTNPTSSERNVIIGEEPMNMDNDFLGKVSYNVLIGHQTGDKMKGNVSDGNVRIGYDAGRYSDAFQSLVIGKEAGQYATGRTVCIGTQAGKLNSSYTTAIGAYAGSRMTTANSNTHVGFQAGQGTAADIGGNTSFGTSALVYMGNASLNTAVGALSLSYIDTGSGNTAIGYQSGRTITTGNSNVCVGYGADCAATVINAISIGSQTFNGVSNTIMLGLNNRVIESRTGHVYNKSITSLVGLLNSHNEITPEMWHNGILHATGTSPYVLVFEVGDLAAAISMGRVDPLEGDVIELIICNGSADLITLTAGTAGLLYGISALSPNTATIVRGYLTHVLPNISATFWVI